jgi:beta-fructofuranosidase
VLVFNCLAKDSSAQRRATGTTGGVWVSSASSALGPFDLGGAQLVTDNRLYVGRFIEDRVTRETKFLAFVNDDGNGHFVGEITDPYSAHWQGARLVLTPVGQDTCRETDQPVDPLLDVSR